MKKFLFSAISCLLIISVFTSCEKKPQKDEPTTPAITKAGFNIDIKDITATGATVTFTPSDEHITYIFGKLPADQFNKDSILAEYTQEFFEEYIANMSAYYKMNVYYSNILTVGVKEFTYNDLTPATDYVAIALGIDTLTFEYTSELVTKPFRTSNYEMKGELAISVSDIGPAEAVVAVTPSNPATTYVFSVVPTAEYNEAELKARYTKAFFDDIIEYYLYEGKIYYYGDLFYIGKEVRLFNNLEPATDYTAFAVGVDTATFMLSTPIASASFKTPQWEKIGEKEISFTDVKYDNYVTQAGWWQLYGESETTDNTFYFVSVSPIETDVVAGNYTMDDMDTDFTFLQYCTISGNDTTVKNISFIEGLFEMKETETGVELDAVVNGSDGYEYTLYIEALADAEESDYAPARRRVAVRRNRAIGLKK